MLLRSDHVALLKAFEGWQEAKRAGRERNFCWENFLSSNTLQMMDDMRRQFQDLLSDIGFFDKSKGTQVRRIPSIHPSLVLLFRVLKAYLENGLFVDCSLPCCEEFVNISKKKFIH